MILTKYNIIFILILAITSSACKKTKPIKKIIQPIDIQLNKNQAIQYSDLTIYPITLSNKPDDTHLLTLQELIQVKGFNPKTHIQGNGAFSNSNGPTEEFFWANKTNKEGITLLGEIIHDDNENIYFLTQGDYLPAKKITHTSIAAISNYGNIHSHSTHYLFPCPPTPLKSILDNNIWEAKEWLRQAIPKIHSTYKKDEETYPVSSMQKIEDEEDNFNDSDYYERDSMENLGSLLDFIQTFEPLTQNKNTAGCLVTYKDKILISYFFDNPYIFQKEWPFLIKSFYLNQLMGHSELDLQECSIFEGTDEVQDQIEKLWIKKSVTPEDNAFRGEHEGLPYYLVLF